MRVEEEYWRTMSNVESEQILSPAYILVYFQNNHCDTFWKQKRVVKIINTNLLSLKLKLSFFSVRQYLVRIYIPAKYCLLVFQCSYREAIFYCFLQEMFMRAFFIKLFTNLFRFDNARCSVRKFWVPRCSTNPFS